MDDNYSTSAIGSRIRARRKMLNMSQEELAKAVGVSQSSITQYEGAKRDMNAAELTKFASVLRVPISYFYGETDPFTHGDRAFAMNSVTYTAYVDTKDSQVRPKTDSTHQYFNYQSIAQGADEEQFLGYYRRLTPGHEEDGHRLDFIAV